MNQNFAYSHTPADFAQTRFHSLSVLSIKTSKNLKEGGSNYLSSAEDGNPTNLAFKSKSIIDSTLESSDEYLSSHETSQGSLKKPVYVVTLCDGRDKRIEPTVGVSTVFAITGR